MSSPSLPVLHQRYRITEKLGQSRLAVVYRAQDLRLQRPVLVHLLRPELVQQATLRERFLDEAQRGAQRSHSGLLEVYDSGDVSGRPYMVTEDITGQPMAEVLPLPVAEAVGVLRTIASAVALSLSQGSPHPPISSRNVWLQPGGRAVLLENWLLAPRDAALDLAHYRAPERAQGAPPSPATTVYALGILGWEAVTGRRPFVGATPEAIAERQLRERLPSLLEVKPRLFIPGLDRVIAGAAVADPARRYPAPVDFGRALDLYVDQATAQTGRLAILPKPAPTPGAPQRAIFRRRGDTAAQPVVKPPPPPAVIRGTPRVARRPAPPPAVAAPEPAATEQQVERAVKRALRRRGCQRAIVKRSIQLALILALIYGALVGIDYATGRVRQFDPAGWLVGRLPQLPALPALPALPDFAWLDRFQDARDIVDGLQGETLVVTQPVNLRPDPSTQNQPLRQLPEGTVLRRLEGPVDDQAGMALRWLRVVVVEDGTEGWVAEQTDRLRSQ